MNLEIHPGSARARTIASGKWLFCLLFAALLLAVLPSQAAAVIAPAEGWGRAYERAAIEYWGETADCATASIEFDSQVPYSYSSTIGDKTVLGRADLIEGPGEDCWMYIAPLNGYGIYFRCVLFAHEYGHWLGVDDSLTDPRTSVSYELLGDYTIDPPCRRLVREATADKRLHRHRHRLAG